MADAPAPRAFMSHSSADKERFVLPFATRLRAAGIDVWVDRWEMLPGDSLVRRIFEEGINNASAVIVVLSRASVNSRWVKEEFDAAVVKRINDDSKLIPIVLDGISVGELPVAIRHLVMEFVPDSADINEAVDRVTRSVFGTFDKPPIGSAPPHTTIQAAEMPALDRLDSLVLKHIGDAAVSENGGYFRTQEFVDAAAAVFGVGIDQVVESLQVLDTDGLIEISRTVATGIAGMSGFVLTLAGIDRYAQAYVSGYGELQHRIAARLVGMPEDGQISEAKLSEVVGGPRFIVDHILTVFETNDWITMSGRTLGGITGRFVMRRSPKLRRFLA